ncbi:MAG: hypothetical protein FJ254_01320 [Phycisphaerae bacterium]|nr:hypothetical protein [Phycisphaerae bacterium]
MPTPFQPGDALSDEDLALAIELDARGLAGMAAAAMLQRWIPSIGSPGDRPMAALAAAEVCIACAIRDGGEPLEAAQQLAAAHPAFADDFMAAALGFGMPEGDLPGDLVPGAIVLGRWRVDRVVGSGATGTVALAVDALLGSPAQPRHVALKRFESDATGLALRHARHELSTLLSLPEGCGPKVIGFHADRAGSAVLVTAWEPSSPPNHLAALPEALWTMDRIHACGIAHGDLKPDHLRLRDDGSVFLIDWGSAGPADHAGRTLDADRLASIVRTIGSSTGTAPWIVAPAAWLCTRDQLGLAATWLAACAPRRHARRLLRPIVPAAAAILIAALFVWLSGPWNRTPAEAAIDRLRARGNLIEVVQGPDGAPAGAWLAWPRFDPAVPARERLVFWIDFKDGLEVISRKSPGSLSPATWPESSSQSPAAPQ